MDQDEEEKEQETNDPAVGTRLGIRVKLDWHFRSKATCQKTLCLLLLLLGEDWRKLFLM